MVIALMIVHFLAIIAALENSLPIPIKILITTAVVISLLYYLKRYGQASDPYTLLHIEAKGWQLMDEKGHIDPVDISPSSVITSLICIVYLLDNGRLRHTLVIVRDAVNAEDYRQLKVRLRIHAAG